MTTTTIYRCPDCPHKHLDHGRNAGGDCSMGGCACRRGMDELAATQPPVVVPTSPAYDQVAKTWAR